MHLYTYYVTLLIAVYYTIVVESAGTCDPPKKFYVDCTTNQSISYAVSTCAQHGMVLLNLTNSSSSTSDIAELNSTLRTLNCSSYFWFSLKNVTGYVGTIELLGGILGALLGGVDSLLNDLLGISLGLANLLPCLPLLCPATTTPAPVTSAVMICTRSIQQRVIRKCLATQIRTDMRTYKFTEEAMYGGILYSIESRSRSACSTQCLSEKSCVGISFINNICTLYM